MSIGKENKKFKPIIFVLLFLTVILAMSAASAADDDATGDAVIAQTSDYDIEEVSAPSEEVAADTEQAPIYSVDDATVTEEDASADINTNTSSDAADVADTDSGAKNVLAADSGSDNLGVGEQDVGTIEFIYPDLYGGDVCDFLVEFDSDDAQGTVTVTIIDTCVPEDVNPRTFVYVMPVNSGVATASQATSITVNGETASFDEVLLWAYYRDEWENGHQKFPDKVTIAYSGDDTYAAKTIETTMEVYPFEAEMSIDGAKIGESYDYGEALGLVEFEVYNPFEFDNPYYEGDFLVVIIPDTVDPETFDPNRDQDKIVKSASVHIVDGEGSLTFDDIFDEGGYLIGIFYDPVNFLKYSVWEGFQVVSSEVGPFVVSSNGKAYPTLEAALAVATEGDTITVIKEGTYTGTANTGLTVAKSVTIAAAGELDVYFDCENNNNFITVQSGKTVTLKDLIIQNGKAEKGGAVYVQNDANLNVDDVEFSYNVANTRGGAIYSEGNVGVFGSTFYKNDITTRDANEDNGGAAIYNYGGNLFVYGSAFDYNLLNYVPREGNSGDLIDGVVVSTGATAIFDSRFLKNSGCYGGALTVLPVDGSNPTLFVSGCNFTLNDAYCSAAIHIEGLTENFQITKCLFTENNVGGTGSPGYGPGGGAIFMTRCTGEDNKITNCAFNGNKGPDGGAINVQRSNLLIEGTNFTENKGGYGAGVSTYYTDLTIKGCEFINNTVTVGGAAVCLDGDSVSKIIESIFLENKAPIGAAIADYSEGTTTIDGCRIIENVDTDSGAVFINDGVVSLTIKDSIFSGNAAPEYRNIYSAVVPATLSGNLFDSNETTIKVNDIVYGENEVINGTFDSGTNLDFNAPVATLVINGEEVTATVPTQTTFTKTVEKPNVGTYTATVDNLVDADNNVILVSGDAGVYNVAKAVADVTVADVEVIYPQTASVTVTSNVSGTYTIRVGNKDYEVVVGEDGSGSVPIDLLEPGVYEIDISADLGPNYEPIAQIPIATYTVKDQTGPFVVQSNGLGYATLAEALAVAEEFDTITVVESGEYTGEGNIGVTIDKTIVLQAQEGKDVVFDAKGADTNILTIANGNYVVLYGLDFTGVDNTNTKFGAVVNHGGLTVTKCMFYNNTVRVNGASGTNGAAAIFNAPDATQLLITDSLFASNLATPTNPTDHINTGGIAAVASWSSGLLKIQKSVFVDNVARFGGAVEIESLNQEEACIDSCTFTMNGGYCGAAININDGTTLVRIVNSDFAANTVHGPQGAPTTGSMGGAICAGYNVPVTVYVDKCNFTRNQDDGGVGSSGGAIRLADYASGVITGCNFIENQGLDGSAICAGTYDGKPATLVVDDCNFVGNVAVDAGTITTSPGIALTVTDSLFSGNTAPEARNIANGGTITEISNNVFTVNETTLEVNDIPYTQDEVINGTVDTGVNFDLTGATVNLEINGVPVSVPVNLNEFTYTVVKPNVGTYEVEVFGVADSEENKYICVPTKTGTFVVSKINPTIVFEGDEVLYGETGNVTILTDVPGFYNVTVNGYSVIVNITDEAVIEIPVMDAGKYDVEIFVGESENYNAIAAVAPEGYVVNKANATVEITGCTVQYPEAGTVTIKTDVAGTYTIFVKGVEAEIVVTETTGQATFVTMAPGQYDIIVNFVGNSNYEAGEWIAEKGYIVTPGLGEITITVPELVYGEEGQGSLKLLDADSQPISGKVSVIIEGRIIEVQTNEQGIGTFQIPILNAGSHDIVAIYVDEETGEGAGGSATLIVDKAHSEILTLNDIYGRYGEVVEFGVSLRTEVGDLWGIVNASIDTNEPIPIFVEDFATVTYQDLSVGPHTVILTFAGNENIIGSQKVVNITIDKAFPKLSVSAEDIYFGDDEIIEVKLTGVDGELLTGIVLITVINVDEMDDGNITVYIPVIEGEGSAIVSGLDVGQHVVLAETLESGNYMYNFALDDFEVFKTEIGYISVSAEDIEFGEEAIANVELYDVYGDGITGTVIVKVDGRDFSVEVVDGKGSVAIPGIPAGRHNIIVVFPDDGRYGEAYNYSSYLTVSKSDDSSVIIFTDDVPYGQPVSISVMIKDKVGNIMNGIVQVLINNVIYNVAVLDGTGTIEVPNLPVGIYEIAANFIGDENYEPSAIVTGDVEVYQALTVLLVSIDDIEYGEDAIIHVTLLDESNQGIAAAVIVTIEGDDYVINTNEDGEGLYTLTGLAAGIYDWTAVYPGASGYAADEDEGEFEVLLSDDIQVDVSISEPKYGEDAIVTIDVSDADGNPIDGTAVFKIEGREPFEAEIENGQAIVRIGELPAGTTVADIQILTDNYEPQEVIAVITVSKSDKAVVTIVGDEIELGEEATILVTVKDGETGIAGVVVVTVNNVDYAVYTNDEGAGILEIANLPAGEYAIAATFQSTDDYEAVGYTGDAKVVVNLPKNITFDLAYDEENNAINVTNAADLAGEPISGYIFGELFKDGVKVKDLEMGMLDDGTGTIALPDDLAPGDYVVLITAIDEDMEYTGTNEIPVTIEPKSGVQVSASVEDYPFSEAGKLVITVTDIDGNPLDGNIYVEVDGEPYLLGGTVTEGKAEIALNDLNVGEHVVEVTFENPNYLTAEATDHFNVTKGTPIVEVAGSTVEYGQPSTVTVLVSYDGLPADGRIIVTVDWLVDGLTQVVELDEGAAEVAFNLSPYVAEGEYNVTVTFIGTDIYNEVVNNTEKVIVTPSTSMELEVTANEPDYGEDVIITVTAKDGSGVEMPVTAVNVTVNGETKEYPVSEDGTVNIGPMDAGTTEIEVSANDGVHAPASEKINVTVNKDAGVQVSASVEDYQFNGTGKLVITVTDADEHLLDGDIFVEIDGEPYLLGGTVTDGKAEIALNDLNVGEHVVVVTFDNPNYLTAEATEHFNVTKITTVLVISGSTVEYGEPSTVDIQVTDDNGNPVTGTVIVNVNWEVEGLFDVVELDEEGKGQASFRLDYYVPEGTYNVNATYLGSDIYKENTDETTVTITPSTELNVEISVNSPTSDEDVIFNVSATDGRGAEVPLDKVNVTVNGETKEYPVDENGQVNIGKLPAGENNVTISVDDGFHNPVEINETVVVSDPALIDTIIAVSSTNISYGDKAVINFAFTDAEGNLLSGTLNVTVGDQEMTVDVVDGVGTIELTGLNADTYPVVADFSGNKSHAAATGTGYFNVAKNATKIIYEDMQTIAVDYYNDGRVGEYFKWRLIDANGNPMANVPMEIGFNGIIYDQKDGIVTDEDGWAQLRINLMKKDLYTFAICWLGDENYNGSFVVARITVDPQTPTITVPNKSYKATASTKTLTATFKSNRGTLIPNKKVTFTVNGKTYSAKTDENGVAKVNVKLTTKGTYTVTAKFAGDNTYEEVTKTATLKIT